MQLPYLLSIATPNAGRAVGLWVDQLWECIKLKLSLASIYSKPCNFISVKTAEDRNQRYQICNRWSERWLCDTQQQQQELRHQVLASAVKQTDSVKCNIGMVAHYNSL